MKKSCHHQALSKDDILFKLKKAGISRTKIKIDVLSLISKAHSPLSVNDIYQKLNQDCNISSIFRTVTQLRGKNIISDVILNDGFTRYELNNSHHHHHVRCRVCEKVERLDQCHLNEIEKSLMKRGFQALEHRLEFSGICGKCAKSDTADLK